MAWGMMIFVVAALPAARCVTMADLLSDSQMNPKRFAAYFEDFDFDLHPFDVQDPEIFLESRKGDCIDYAVMADHVLRRDGYGTRLIRVEMIGKNMGHAICYVNQNSAYLDYNNRKYFLKLQKSGSRLREIATRVADSFDANWTFASEFTYTYKEDVKRAVMTVVKTDAPDTDPDAPGNAGQAKQSP
jgi:Transglutaminase-like domain